MRLAADLIRGTATSEKNGFFRKQVRYLAARKHRGVALQGQAADDFDFALQVRLTFGGLA
jgi:hypothetical protein